MINVLIVDDSKDSTDLITHLLSPLKLSIDVAASITEARKLIAKEEYHLFLIDIALPDGDGYELLSVIRGNPSFELSPIVVISASSGISSKLSAFSIGADDYICKPFDTLEFVARISAKIKKIQAINAHDEVIHFGPLALYSSKQIIKVVDSSEKINLTPIDFRLLMLLIKNKEIIFTRQQILDNIWGNEVSVSDRTVDTHIYLIRKKLGEYSSILVSVPGEGYKVVPNFIPKKTRQSATVKNI